ncbi:hypothetical protein BIY24_13940 [Halobacteriovorax marinus]|uniref:DNA repair protein RecO n=1 Tax=Halobacteriovorax marinus TaxID=97084 RepID=UPI000BC2FCCC|nr:recombination protein O N-terminal domain-containing protein [Halobacteriovorax marinus]ATH09007.1 hypothetical protein BIY24_13940 [Halobacteriovorax marinus]
MMTKVEGIILSKTPYKDRHLVCRVLLRSGEKISAIFYGGQGGGNKKKSSFLELGHLVKVELTRAKPGVSIFSVKEWSPSWHHKSIRENHKAFYLLCAFLEISDKLVVDADLHEGHYQDLVDKDSMFKVLSNAIFYLEKNTLERDQFSADLFHFVSKTLIEQGVFPERNNCVLSGASLHELSQLTLIDEHGGFADTTCLNQDMRDGRFSAEEGKIMWNFLCQVALKKYSELQETKEIPLSYSNRLLDYLCFQVQMSRNDFKTLSLLF